jgi:hypothetical protein
MQQRQQQVCTAAQTGNLLQLLQPVPAALPVLSWLEAVAPAPALAAAAAVVLTATVAAAAAAWHNSQATAPLQLVLPQRQVATISLLLQCQVMMHAT